ncbi:MAG: alkaline phosphatase family protein [Chloroflexi bacterium]|nr:alkaline phosphatase family protein [Chloroflexota bacterium]
MRSKGAGDASTGPLQGTKGEGETSSPTLPHPHSHTPTRQKRVLVLGLDSGEPSLVFDQFAAEMPNLSRLRHEGVWGKLESVIPPITVPAWACSMSSKDPGQLGIYGFRNRADHSYENMTIANGRSVEEKQVWDYLGEAGKQSILVGVPPSYPPKPVQGIRVGCFLSPNTDAKYTFPENIRDEIRQVAPNYMVDVPNFRTEDKNWLLGKIYEMTEERFKVIRHFMKTKPWDYFMAVEIGVDRLHHGFWKYHDTEHPKHEPGNSLVRSIRDYYTWLDKQIGSVLELVDDDTSVMLMSDHGAKRMEGGIALNEWLINEGYLVLEEKPNGIVPIEKCKVNWARTRAWGSGGYYGRIFLNVKGREPNGVIEANRYEDLRNELVEKLLRIPDDKGRPIPTRVYKPQGIYQEAKNVPPDLIVIFGDLYWRAVGYIGLNALHTFENDTGPDDANHAQDGIFVYYDPRRKLGGRELSGMRLTDVGPTVLHEMGEIVPADMIGRVIEVNGQH